MLNYFEPCTLQIGDRNYYTLKENDIIMMRDEWKKLEKESFLGISADIEPSKSKVKRMKKAAKASALNKNDAAADSDEDDQVCFDSIPGKGLYLKTFHGRNCLVRRTKLEFVTFTQVAGKAPKQSHSECTPLR
jgi:hypothetical protein